MSYKVVRNAGQVVCFGPDDDNYSPTLKNGDVLAVEANFDPALVAKSNAEIIADMTAKVQKRLDDFAKTRNYDGILSACTYVTSLVPKFATEAAYCVSARDNTWATFYAVVAAVQSQARAMPTEAQLMAELPTLAWPA